MCFLCEWKRSSHPPQLAIKHLHHVVLWSAIESIKRQRESEGKGCLRRKQSQAWKNREKRGGRRRKKQTVRAKLRKDTNRERQRDRKSQTEKETTAEQL